METPVCDYVPNDIRPLNINLKFAPVNIIIFYKNRKKVFTGTVHRYSPGTNFNTLLLVTFRVIQSIKTSTSTSFNFYI